VREMEEHLRAAREKVEAYEEPELELEPPQTPSCLELLRWAVDHIYEPKHESEQARQEWEARFEEVREMVSE
jgi:hypothetical protein